MEIKKTPFHIVLDLDNTLIYTYDNSVESCPIVNNFKLNTYNFKIFNVMNNSKIGNGDLETICGVFRPHVIDFLRFCTQYFDKIHIWSAGQHKYVHHIVHELFSKNNLPMPANIFTYDDCILSKNDDVIKPLSLLFTSSKSFGANPTNTFIIDDIKHTFSKNIKNGVNIPEFKPKLDIKLIDNDICLQQLMYWFLKKSTFSEKDVRKLNKKLIFKEKLSTLLKIESFESENVL